MSDVKRCVQCGLLKEAEMFRKYTYSKAKETEGRYRICRSCEAINTGYRKAKDFTATPFHIMGNPPQAEKMFTIITKTEQLYKTLELRGLRVPTAPHDEPNNLDSLLAFYKEPAAHRSTIIVAPASIPDELIQWLEADMQEWIDTNISPEYLQETVYESLKAKYRPQTGVDRDSFVPVYDDTYKDILNKILRRFDDYEEEYIDKTEQE